MTKISVLVAVSLLVLLTVPSMHCLIACQKDTCSKVKCNNATPATCNKPNQDVRKGGFCNCCDVCFTTISDYEKCPQIHTIGGPPPTSGCRDGSECENGTCVPKTY